MARDEGPQHSEPSEPSGETLGTVPLPRRTVDELIELVRDVLEAGPQPDAHSKAVLAARATRSLRTLREALAAARRNHPGGQDR